MKINRQVVLIFILLLFVVTIICRHSTNKLTNLKWNNMVDTMKFVGGRNQTLDSCQNIIIVVGENKFFSHDLRMKKVKIN